MSMVKLLSKILALSHKNEEIRLLKPLQEINTKTMKILFSTEKQQNRDTYWNSAVWTKQYDLPRYPS